MEEVQLRVLFHSLWILVVSQIADMYLGRGTIVRLCQTFLINLIMNINFIFIVILRGTSSNPNFRGFLIQGRKQADESAVGSFGSGTGYQSRCAGDVSCS